MTMASRNVSTGIWILSAGHGLLVADRASAATGTEAGQGVKLVIIAGTVVGALLLGLLLYWFSQRSSRVKFKSAKEKPPTRPPPGLGQEAITPLLFQELSQLAVPVTQRERIAQTVSDIVTKTVQQQTTLVKRELDERYGQIIEEKRRSEVALQRRYDDVLGEKKQTMAVLESIAEGLVVVNNKGEVVMMNPAAEKLLAVDQKERIGKPLMEQLSESQLISLVSGASKEDREITLSAKQDSTKRVLRASNAVITDEDGNAMGMVAVLSDVTRQREVDQVKTDFVSTVSHELRTPIVAMEHALAIVADQLAGPLSEEQQKFVGIVRRNLERLTALINDLLDLSKLEARKMELRLESVEIGSILQSVCGSLEAWAGTKAITITKRLAEGLPKVTVDPARIAQVLTNLIGNAVKFTPKQGRITVEAKLAADRRAIEVSVADTGIGIAKEDLPKLFGKFQQVGQRAASDISGTGLGLALSKDIIELHRGRIWAEGELKKGARFVFTVPLTA